MCKNPTPNVFECNNLNPVQPEAGLHISIHTGYAMFSDIMEEDEIEKLTKIVLCHDCSITFIEMFPLDFQQLFRTGHPNDMCGDSYSKMGCNYSWNSRPYLQEPGHTKPALGDRETE